MDYDITPAEAELIRALRKLYKPAPPDDESAPTATTPPAPAPSIGELRGAIRERALDLAKSEEGRATLKALLAKYRVARATAVPDECAANFLADLSA